ncbi:hypothetical protein EI77_00113 [Prosthecobacter fusiformis]|uniref:Ribonuclease VapC n=1 Tax=Prosthecobacter fusiformis TaxID=48464 RepID=A0A4R7SQA5_9BACT|nr:type II toxin-antitoxin system VapC family toxin [Prosthecobacter fusiformis]TDU80815.1 hypothetical protein EI77_00113 [Prosthecobacter fusiformis]
MIYLLDTNVLSEGMKPSPDLRVTAWMDLHQEDCAISVITLAELARGVEAIDEGKRKNELLRRLSFLQEDYSDLILPVDDAVAWEWARYCRGVEEAGFVPSVMDSLIAATALSYGLTVVTRNTGDFPLVPVLDPFLL